MLLLLFISIITIVVACSLHFAFLETSKTLGRQAAFTNLRYSIFYILITFLAILIVGLLRYDPQDNNWPEKNSWLNIPNLIYIMLIIAGIDTFFRRMKAGSLLLNLGKNPKRKQLLRVGLGFISLGAFDALLTFRSSSSEESPGLIYQLSIFYCIWGIYNLALAISKLELCENGIWCMCSLIKWKQIKSYVWDLDNVNVLTIQFRPRFPLTPASTSLAIPERYRDAVNQILNDHLSHRIL